METLESYEITEDIYKSKTISEKAKSLILVGAEMRNKSERDQQVIQSVIVKAGDKEEKREVQLFGMTYINKQDEWIMKDFVEKLNFIVEKEYIEIAVLKIVKLKLAAVPSGEENRWFYGIYAPSKHPLEFLRSLRL